MPTQIDLLLGRIAVNRGLISRDNLEACLMIQEKENYKRPLGRILVEEKLITPEVLQSLLHDQKAALALRDDQRRRREEDLSFGEIALRKEVITNEKLEQALRRQAELEEKGYFPRLGEIMVQLKFLTAPMVDEILDWQRRRVFFCEFCSKAFFRDDTLPPSCPDCGATITRPEQAM